MQTPSWMLGLSQVSPSGHCESIEQVVVVVSEQWPRQTSPTGHMWQSEFMVHMPPFVHAPLVHMPPAPQSEFMMHGPPEPPVAHVLDEHTPTLVVQVCVVVTEQCPTSRTAFEPDGLIAVHVGSGAWVVTHTVGSPASTWFVPGRGLNSLTAQLPVTFPLLQPCAEVSAGEVACVQ